MTPGFVAASGRSASSPINQSGVSPGAGTCPFPLTPSATAPSCHPAPRPDRPASQRLRSAVTFAQLALPTTVNEVHHDVAAVIQPRHGFGDEFARDDLPAKHAVGGEDFQIA